MEIRSDLHQIQIQRLKALYKFRSNSLTFGELPTNLIYKGHEYEIQFHKELFGMSFQNATPVSRFHLSSLRTALLESLPEATSALLTIGNSTVAIRRTNSQGYILFDSHSRSDTGLVSDKGSAILIYFSTLEQLLCHLQRLSCSLSASALPFELQTISVKRATRRLCSSQSLPVDNQQNEIGCSSCNINRLCLDKPKLQMAEEKWLNKYLNDQQMLQKRWSASSENIKFDEMTKKHYQRNGSKSPGNST